MEENKQPRTRLREWLNYGITQGVHVNDGEGHTFIVDWIGSMSVQGRELVPVDGVEGIKEVILGGGVGYARKDKYGPTKVWDIRAFVLRFDLSVGHVCLRCKHQFDVTGAAVPDSEADCPKCDS